MNSLIFFSFFSHSFFFHRNRLLLFLHLLLIPLLFLLLLFLLVSSSSYSSSECSSQGQVFHCKLRHQGCSSAQKQVFHRKHSNQDCNLLGMYCCAAAVASRCFPHPTLSLASEQTLKNLKRTPRHQRGCEESGFG